jgi:hypothetical protein
MGLVRSRAVLIAGQSYGDSGYISGGGSYGPFMESVRRAIVADAAAVQARLGGSPTLASQDVFRTVDAAVDGSAVLQANKGSADNYWLEDDGTTNGPRMTAALSAISGASEDWALTVYSHGEQDAGFATTTAIAENVADGMATIWSKIRTAQTANYAIFVDVLGPRFAVHEFNEYRLRDAMLAEIAAGTNVFRGAEKYSALLDSTTHPSQKDGAGYAYLGAQTGRKVATWLQTGTPESGPTISGVTRSGNTVTVAITVPGGRTLQKPAAPEFFGLFNSAGERLTNTAYSWDGNNLTITGSGAPATFRYPARPTKPHSVESIVRLNNPSDPLYTGEPGLPLESIATVSL